MADEIEEVKEELKEEGDGGVMASTSIASKKVIKGLDAVQAELEELRERVEELEED